MGQKKYPPGVQENKPYTERERKYKVCVSGGDEYVALGGSGGPKKLSPSSLRTFVKNCFPRFVLNLHSILLKKKFVYTLVRLYTYI